MKHVLTNWIKWKSDSNTRVNASLFLHIVTDLISIHNVYNVVSHQHVSPFTLFITFWNTDEKSKSQVSWASLMHNNVTKSRFLTPRNKVLSGLGICKICKYDTSSFPHQTEHGWEPCVAKVATGAFRSFSLPLSFEHAGESPVSWVHIKVAKTLFWLLHKLVNCFNSLANK